MRRNFPKMLLSGLIALTMIFSPILQFNFNVSAAPAIANTSLQTAINSLPAAEKASNGWNLSNKNILGEVNLDDIKADYPQVAQINFSNNDISKITFAPPATPINVAINDTFANGNRKIIPVTNVTAIFADTTVNNGIKVSDVLTKLQVVNSALNLQQLMNATFAVQVVDSTGTPIIVNGSSITYTGNLNNPNDVLFQASVLNTVAPNTNYKLIVSMYFKNDTSSYNVNLPLTIGRYKIDIATNIQYDGVSSSYSAYIRDEIEAVVTLRDSQGNPIRITDKAHYTVTAKNSAGAAAPTAITSIDTDAAGNLIVKVAASVLGLNTNLAQPASIEIVNNNMANGSDFKEQLNIIVLDYFDATAVQLSEYNTGVAIKTPIAGLLTANPVNSDARTINVSINVYSSTSSTVSANVGDNVGAYAYPTVYPLEITTGGITRYLDYTERGMVTFNTVPGFKAEIVNTTIAGVPNVAAIQISAETATVGQSGNIVATFTNKNTAQTVTYTFNTVAVDFRPTEIRIYQIPRLHYRDVLAGLAAPAQLIQIQDDINNSVAGYVDIARYEYTPVQVNNTNYPPIQAGGIATIPQGGTGYFVPVTKSQSGKWIIPTEAAISEWYDYSHQATKFGIAPQAFTNTAFNGEYLSGAKQITIISTLNTVNPNDEVTIGLALKGNTAFPTAFTFNVKAVEKSIDKVYLGVPDGVGGTHYYNTQDAPLPIGINADFQIFADYSNGATKVPLNYNDFTSVTVSDMNIVPNTGNPHMTVAAATSPQKLKLTATNRGGYTRNLTKIDDDLLGQVSIVKLTDAKGTYSLNVVLTLPLVTDFNYYIVSAPVNTINLNTLTTAGVATAQTEKRLYDYDHPFVGSVSSPNANILDLPKGELYEVYIVPVFTNLDRNDAMTNYNVAGKHNYIEFSISSGIMDLSKAVNQTNPLTYSNLPADFALSADASVSVLGPNGIEVGNYLYTAPGQTYAPKPGDEIIWTIQTNNTDPAINNGFVLAQEEESLGLNGSNLYQTYDSVTRTKDVSLSTTLKVKVKNHYVNKIDAEDYSDPANHTKDFYKVTQNASIIPPATVLENTYARELSSITAPLNADVGVEKLIRVGVGYNDSEALDSLFGKYSNTYGGSATSLPVFSPIIPIVNDSIAKLDAVKANSVANKLEVPQPWSYFDLNLDLKNMLYGDVARAYFAHNDTGAYSSQGMAGTFTNAVWNPLLNNGKTDADILSIVKQEQAKIIIKVYEVPAGAGAWTDVTTAFKAAWTTDYPGVFTVTPNRLPISGSTFKVMFYQDVVIGGTTYQVPAYDSAYANLYDITLTAQSNMDGITLASDNVAYDALNTPPYTYSSTIPGSFTIYPVLYSNSALSGAVAAADKIKGLSKADVIATPGIDFMYVNDFPAYATQLSVIENAFAPSQFISQQLTTETIGGKAVICIKVTISIKLPPTPAQSLKLSWAANTTYNNTTPFVAFVDNTHFLLNGGTTSNFDFTTQDQLLVVDVDASKPTIVVNNVDKSTFAPGAPVDVFIGESIKYQLQYKMNGDVTPGNTFMNLTASQLDNLSPANNTWDKNELHLIPDPLAPNPALATVTTTIDAVTGESYIIFEPTVTGTYTYIYQTINSQGQVAPPSTRRIVFEVQEKLPSNQTIAYGENKLLETRLSGNRIPQYVLVSDTNNTLDTAALTQGILRMTQNQNSTAIVKVVDQSGLERGRFTVTMTAIAVTSTEIIPSDPLVPNTITFAPGQTILIREKVTYSTGIVEYHNISTATLALGSTVDFLTNLGDGKFKAAAAGITDGQTTFYTVTSSSGATQVITAKYSLSHIVSTQDYTFAINTPVLTPLNIQAGDNTLVAIIPTISGSSVDDVSFVVRSGAAHIALSINPSAWQQIKVIGISAGTATVDVLNADGTRTDTLTINVSNPLSFTTNPTDTTVNAGISVTFTSATTGGTTPITYQWQMKTPTGVWANIVGETNATLTIANPAVALSGNSYKVIATDANSKTATSGTAILTVNAITFYTVSGTVTNSVGGLPINGANIQLKQGALVMFTATTDTLGAYTTNTVIAPLVPIVPDGTYDLVVSMAGFVTSTPVSITVNGGNIVVPVIALVPGANTYTVSGTITNSVGATPIIGATVVLQQNGTIIQTVTSTATGYSIANVAPGTSYKLVVTMATYTTHTYDFAVAGNVVHNVSMSAGASTYTVSGKVTGTGGIALSGAIVTITGLPSVTTNATGDYIINGVANGNNTIAAVYTGYDSITNSAITLNNANLPHNIAMTATNGGSGGTGGGGNPAPSTPTLSAIISMDPKTLEINASGAATFVIKKDGVVVSTPADATMKWKIADESIAAISSGADAKTASILAKKAGKTQLTLTVTTSAGTYTGTLDITVNAKDIIVPLVKDFKDVPPSYWAYDYIMSLANSGIVNGYEDGTFRPDNSITRNEMAAMIARSITTVKATDEQLTKAAGHFADWNIVADWSKNYWAIAYSKGLVLGSLVDEKYYAEGERNISRQEVAVIFSRLLTDDKTKAAKFSDNDTIAPWALAAVEECIEAGLINGYPDNTFLPLNDITRAECAKIFSMYLSK